MHKIITVSRQFGSGGREFGKRLAEKLGYAYYDQEIIKEIAKRTKLSQAYISRMSERKPLFSYPIHIGLSFSSLDSYNLDQSAEIIKQQYTILNEAAERSSCLIVGRAADYLLRDYQPFRIFIYADLASKIARCQKREKEAELSENELKKKIRLIDKNRAAYYKYLTDQKWGEITNYDLCLNTSRFAIKDLVEAVALILRMQSEQ